MSAPLDGDLAWVILGWAVPNVGERPRLSREEAESLARHLTAEGFSRQKSGNDLGILGELLPIADKLRKVGDDFLKGNRESRQSPDR